MNKIETIKEALELLKKAGAGEGVVSELEEELRTLTDRDADVAAFREMVLGKSASDICETWENSSENSKNHYRQRFEAHKKFFDELGKPSLLEKGETPDKNLKYKDQDGDIWHWNGDKEKWYYVKPSGNDYEWLSNGFPSGGYASLFPMEVVR